jgi:hypothetical protein
MDHLDLQTNLAEILSKYPETSHTLRKFGILTTG